MQFLRRLNPWLKSTAPAVPMDTVQQARRRARHRLIGAVVLVVAAVIVFPMLFETEPRPVGVDLPIEIPSRDSVPPLPAPAPSPSASGAVTVPAPTRPENTTTSPEPAPALPPATPAGPAPAAAPASAPASATPAAPKAPPPAPAPSPAPPPPPPPPPKAPAPAPAPRPAPAPAPAPTAEEAQRARALLEGRQPPAAAARFVVQVGAYADEAKVREVRTQLEGMGLKTYTQEVDTPQGKRTRVRIGPFSSREEADRAAARVKAAGLPMVVLTL